MVKVGLISHNSNYDVYLFNIIKITFNSLLYIIINLIFTLFILIIKVVLFFMNCCIIDLIFLIKLFKNIIEVFVILCCSK